MRVAASTVLPHDPEAVFDFVADMRNDEHWVGLVRDVEQLAGDGPGPGAQYRFTQSMGRHAFEMTSTMEVYDRPREIQWRIEHPAMDYHATMRFTPDRRGTRLKQINVESWHFAPFWVRLLAPGLVRRQMKRQLALLRQALDRQAASAASKGEG